MCWAAIRGKIYQARSEINISRIMVENINEVGENWRRGGQMENQARDNGI